MKADLLVVISLPPQFLQALRENFTLHLLSQQLLDNLNAHFSGMPVLTPVG